MPPAFRTVAAVLALVLAGSLLAAGAWAQGGTGTPPGSTTPTPPPPPPPPPPKLVVDKPVKKVLIREGQAERRMLSGTWYFRLDDLRVGDSQRFFAQRSLSGWTPVRLPHNWNGTDTQLNKSSVGWYRKEFELPRAPRGKRLAWKLRFESVNHRAFVWLNGRRIGAHSPGYFPFELDLTGLRKGRNSLVVKVSTLRASSDLTHWRRARFNGYGTGGWWNFGGISREVYVRPIDGLDIEDVAVMPQLKCNRCKASVPVRIRLRNVGRKERRVAIALRLRDRRSTRVIELTPRKLGGGATREFATKFSISRPRLWQPGSPNLYGLEVTASFKDEQARYGLAFGVRRLTRLKDGRLLLNGRRLRLRGASVHEDDPRTGAALTAKQRSRLVQHLRSAGATITRAHYPVHPAFLEALDRAGIVYWSQAPVYQISAENMADPLVRRASVEVNRDIVLRDKNHPSIIAWSIANELPDEQLPAQSRFILEAARAVRELDRTRLVAIDRRSLVGQVDPVPAIQAVQAIGINEYFGWYYASLIGRASLTSDLPVFLDKVHQAYPGKALMVTEYGAESNKDGPATEKGTHQFQSAWMRDHTRLHFSRRFVSGSIAWILKDFRVHPTWHGGNPAPNPPWNNKGIVDESGSLKPAFYEMQRIWRATRPLVRGK